MHTIRKEREDVVTSLLKRFFRGYRLVARRDMGLTSGRKRDGWEKCLRFANCEKDLRETRL